MSLVPMPLGAGEPEHGSGSPDEQVGQVTKTTGKAGRNPAPRVRISRGVLKGRWVTFADDGRVRPTPSRVRESVLSMIAHLAPTHAFIDLFAGSGIMGFNAWSMGWQRLIMIDNDVETCRTLQLNARNLGVSAEILCRPADALNRLSLSAPLIVYCDPPFDRDDLARWVLDELTGLEAFDARSWCIVESENRLSLAAPPGLSLIKQRSYGRVKITFFARTSRGASESG